jgi:hypothetical protein
MEETAERDLLYARFKPLNKMSKREMKEELSLLRTLWQVLPFQVREFYLRLGTPVVVLTSYNRKHYGELVGGDWALKEVTLAVYEKEFNVNTGKWMWERKLLRMPVETLKEFAYLQEVKPEEEEAAETAEVGGS